MSIQLYDFTSGVGTSGIQGYVEADRVHYETFNRPLKRLLENDESIIASIDSSVITSRLTASSISSRSGSAISVNNNVVINGNVSILGSTVNILVSDLYVRDNIIVVNASQTLGAGGKAGMQIDRGTGDPATFLFHEDDHYWHFSHSGIKGDTLKFDNIITQGVDTSYIDFTSVVTPTVPASNKVRFFINEDAAPSYRRSDGYVANFNVSSIGKFNNYIYNQKTFEDYFGNSSLGNYGTTERNTVYSRIDGKVNVFPLANEKVMMLPGSYRLSTYVNIRNGFNLEGTSGNECTIMLTDASAGFAADSWLSSGKVKNVRFDNFVLDGSGVSFTRPEIFNLKNVENAVFRNKVTNCGVSSVYNGYGSTLDVTFGDAEGNSAVVFKDVRGGRVEGSYDSNLTLCESCVNMILYGFVDGTHIFGTGDYDF